MSAILKVLKVLLGSSWITSLIGSAAAAAGVNIVGLHNPDGSLNYAVLVGAILVYLWGRFQKDARITGGSASVPTVPNPPVLPATVATLASEPTPEVKP